MFSWAGFISKPKPSDGQINVKNTIIKTDTFFKISGLNPTSILESVPIISLRFSRQSAPLIQKKSMAGFKTIKNHDEWQVKFYQTNGVGLKPSNVMLKKRQASI